jgi:hypothetical protein
MLFQERGRLQTRSVKFLLFVKEKLPFGTDSREDEWISTQATRAMETFDPVKDRKLYPGVIDIVRWRGLGFASSVYVTFVPSFHSPSFVDGSGQSSAAIPRRMRSNRRLRLGAYRV